MERGQGSRAVAGATIVVPPIAFDGSLPIHARREEIAQALLDTQVLIVSGATGSGKSTQLPKICLDVGRGRRGLIGHTQPRRIAAQALARRIAEELGSTVGDLVGYQIRFSDRTGPRTVVKLMTDGVLLRELERDPLLRRYDTLIIDEAHERSLNIDFLLGVLQKLLPRRPDLRLIVTSATIETERFGAYFGGATLIDVAGRSYAVETRYRPVSEDRADSPSMAEAVAAALRELAGNERGIHGDALVFLPGERQIHETREHLQRAGMSDWDVLPLYSRLSSADQERVFAPHPRRRAILATNVAETSLTIPGVRFVIDTGLARISRYSPRSKFQRLPIEPISQASAEQRKGRCGREGEGICIRLYAAEDFEQRPVYTDPEIRRTNLASLILQMAALGLGAPEDFPFLDAPDTRALNDGYRLLQELNAVDGDRRITRLGRRMAALPVDPRLARVLLEAARLGCMPEALVITAFLSLQDPRERPGDAAQAADEQHAVFADERSDFVTVLNLWQAYRQHAAANSGSALRRWCREHFLSYVRMREWLDLHEQLAALTRREPQGTRVDPVPGAVLHQAILSGFLGGIGVLDEARRYLGARDTRFVIAPGTPLRRRAPHWVVAASLVETTQLFARMVAAIQPSWIESAAAHLVRRSYAEAQWDEARGMAMARETVSLYGRVLSSGRLVPFSTVDREAAQRMFVEEALVAGRSRLRAPFLERNAAARARVELLERKLRRRDLLASDEELTQFYLQRIAPQASGVRAFERWWAKERELHPQRLDLPDSVLLRTEPPASVALTHPDTLAIDGNALPFEYRFDPTRDDDGVTLTVAQPLLPAVPAARLEWLVPGLVLEKVVALLRALPKTLRRPLVPVPAAAARFVAAHEYGVGSLYARLAEFVTRECGMPVDGQLLRGLPLPTHLQLRLRIVDLDGRVLRVGHDLSLLREGQGRETPSAAAATDPRWERSGLKTWDFEELPDEVLVQRQGLSLRLYPALEDAGASVRLRLLSQGAEAQRLTRGGALRLAALALPQQQAVLRRDCFEDRELSLLIAGAGLGRSVLDDIADRAVGNAIFGEPPRVPRSRLQFAALVDAGRAQVVQSGERLAGSVREILTAAREVRAQLESLGGEAFIAVRAEAEQQLQRLLPPDFVRRTPEANFGQLPKYLRALARRIERARGDVGRDAALAARLRPYDVAFAALLRQPRLETTEDAIARLRWSIEEYRLSVFAQELRTLAPISARRLDAQLSELRA